MSITTRLVSPFAAKAFGIASVVLLVAILGVYWWGASWHGTARKLQAWQDTMVTTIRQASGNQDVTAETAGGQVVEMGESNRRLKVVISNQNESIDQMARAAVQAQRDRKVLADLLAKAKAQRSAALKRLSNLSITPGTRTDCLQLVREADEATEIIHKAAKEGGL